MLEAIRHGYWHVDTPGEPVTNIKQFQIETKSYLLKPFRKVASTVYFHSLTLQNNWYEKVSRRFRPPKKWLIRKQFPVIFGVIYRVNCPIETVMVSERFQEMETKEILEKTEETAANVLSL
jgi:hypothetical protein